MFERIRRKAKVRNMTDERNEKLEGRTDGEAFEEAALRYLSSQRRKTQADFDDLMLD